ncbi:MAG: peptidoglycan DD-metalloendopeptidase family protein [Gammaproteobacteria bacterium]
MRDYKFSLEEDSRPPLRRSHFTWIGVAVALGILSMLVFAAPEQAEANKKELGASGDAVVGETTQRLPDDQISVDLALPEKPYPAMEESQSLYDPHPEATPPSTSPSTPLEWRILTVRRGDSLAALFAKNGLSAGELQRILRLGKAVSDLKRVYPGNEIRVATNHEGLIQKLILKTSPTRKLVVTREGEAFTAETQVREYEIRLAHASGTIENSLFNAATKAGLSERLTMELAGIFGWDIDFALDIRRGDRFSLIFEELYLDGEKVKNGRIVAAEFVNQGREVRAVLFTKDNGVSDYYSPDGRSMRKAFLRSPVDFRRISSRFQGSRWHPVLGKRRPHRGVDYAAAIGTPIKASGDGKVIFAGNKGGYGKTVMIRHGQTYTTLYAHMSRIARGIRSGKRVRQGQTIGYVGRSGLATGPHLHYEFRVNGVHRNPLTVKLPQARPLEKRYREEFDAHAQALLAKLDTMTRVALAQTSDAR